MTDAVAPLEFASDDEQIAAVLGPNIFQWAVRSLPAGVQIDDVRYCDLISVTEDDVFAHVATHGFDPRVVVEDAVFDDRTCIVASALGWRVFYTERGQVSQEATFESKAEARREAVRRQMQLAQIILDHRYRHRHAGSLPAPGQECC